MQPGQIAIASRGCPTVERTSDVVAEMASIEKRRIFLDTIINSNINIVVGLMNNLSHLRQLSADSISDADASEVLTTYFPAWHSMQPLVLTANKWRYEAIPLSAFKWNSTGDYGYRPVDVIRTSPNGVVDSQLNVIHVVYRTWEDNDIPGKSTTSTDPLHGERSFYKLLRLVYKFAGYYHSRNTANVSPQRLLVHCAAGIGRTGTFLAAYAYFNPTDPASHSIESIINHMRGLRRTRMVYTKPQFSFLIKFAYDIYKNVDGWRDALYPVEQVSMLYVNRFASHYLVPNGENLISAVPRLSSRYTMSSNMDVSPMKSPLMAALDQFEAVVMTSTADVGKRLDFGSDSPYASPSRSSLTGQRTSMSGRPSSSSRASSSAVKYGDYDYMDDTDETTDEYSRYLDVTPDSPRRTLDYGRASSITSGGRRSSSTNRAPFNSPAPSPKLSRTSSAFSPTSLALQSFRLPDIDLRGSSSGITRLTTPSRISSRTSSRLSTNTNSFAGGLVPTIGWSSAEADNSLWNISSPSQTSRRTLTDELQQAWNQPGSSMPLETDYYAQMAAPPNAEDTNVPITFTRRTTRKTRSTNRQ